MQRIIDLVREELLEIERARNKYLEESLKSLNNLNQRLMDLLLSIEQPENTRLSLPKENKANPLQEREPEKQHEVTESTTEVEILTAKELGQKIKEERINRGLSWVDLFEATEYSQSTILKLEEGRGLTKTFLKFQNRGL